MIFDADTHFVPLEVLEKIDPILFRRKKHHCQPMNTDRAWSDFYNKIKDPTWPDCPNLMSFVDLPSWIKEEIRTQHHTEGLFVVDTLDSVIFDPPENEWPDLETTASAGKYIFKTQRQVLNPHDTASIISYQGDSDFAKEFMLSYNTVMKEICDKSQRFDTPMWLALQHFDLCMQHLESTQAQGFFGVRLIDHFPWGYLEHLDPMYQYCERHRIPLYLHLATSSEEPPFDWHWNYEDKIYNLLNNRFPPGRFGKASLSPIMGLLSFIYGGVLDRYPDLRIVSTENGLEWLPGARKWCIDNGMADPLPYFQRNFWFTIEVEEENFLTNAQLLGWERLLYATDYPHNDIGGLNRFRDLTDLTEIHDKGLMSQDDFNSCTHKNYLKLLKRI